MLKKGSTLGDRVLTVGVNTTRDKLTVVVLAKTKGALSGNSVTLYLSGNPIKTAPVILSSSKIEFAKNSGAEGFPLKWVGCATIEIGLLKLPTNAEVSVVLSKGDERASPFRFHL